MITFYRTKLIEQEYTTSVEEFVLEHLKEVRVWGKEYDFYISCGVNRGYLSRVLSIPMIECYISDLEDDDCIIEALTRWTERNKGDKL